MANKSVLSNQGVNSAGGSRHGYSLGQNFKFSMSTGMLLPAYSCFVNVGEQISGKPSFFIRADHLLNPVMGDVDVFVDCFFVPIRHLFAPFEQWLYQIDDNQSDLINTATVGYGPHFPVLNAGTHPFAFISQNDYQAQNSFGGYMGFDLHRLLMHLGYNPQSIFKSVVGSTPLPPSTHKAYLDQFQSVLLNTDSANIPLYKLGAYQKIYMDYYRNTDFEPNNVQSYNFDSAFSTGSVSLSSLSNWESGRAGLLSLRYRDINKDYFTAIHPNPLFSGIGMLDTAGLLTQMNNWLTESHYNLNGNEGNLNIFASNPFGLGTGDDFDRWTDLVGNSLTDNQNVRSSTNGHLKTVVPTSPNTDVQQIKHTHLISDTGLSYFTNTAALRGMFALDKLLRITQRAGKHVDDQTLAHFGFKQPAGIANETYVLKSYHSIFHFGEVTSTASTSQADLGQMAGRGVAMLSDQQPFSFVAPCPGVFMAIISCAPRRVYLGAVEKDGFKCYLPDFFKPSVDNLGMQPMNRYEVGNPYIGSETAHWQYRFMEDKIKFDRGSLLFTTNDKSSWIFGYTAPWISMTDNVTQAYRSRFKVSPYDINDVFVKGYDGRPAFPNNTDDDDNFCNFPRHYLTDPFNVDFSMNFKRVSKMSIFGEPVLGGIC